MIYLKSINEYAILIHIKPLKISILGDSLETVLDRRLYSMETKKHDKQLKKSNIDIVNIIHYLCIIILLGSIIWSLFFAGNYLFITAIATMALVVTKILRK